MIALFEGIPNEKKNILFKLFKLIIVIIQRWNACLMSLDYYNNRAHMAHKETTRERAIL